MTQYFPIDDGISRRTLELDRTLFSSPPPVGNAALARRPVVLLEMEPGPRQDLVAATLRGGGATVIATPGGQPLKNLDAVFASQVVVLDSGMASFDGLAFCRALAAIQGPPVMLLMASDGEDERIAGLDAGADDCIPPWTSASEVLARVSALVRRGATRNRVESSTLDDMPPTVTFAGWSLCPGSGELRSPAGRTEFLSRANHALLCAFVERPRQVLSLRELAELTGGEPPPGADWRVRISRLRARFNRLGGGTSLIQTVHGKGYVFTADCQGTPSGR